MERILQSSTLEVPDPLDCCGAVDLEGSGREGPSTVHTSSISAQVLTQTAFFEGSDQLAGSQVGGQRLQDDQGPTLDAREAGLRAGSILYREAVEAAVGDERAAELMAPTGQLVMDWGAGQLGLDGRVYAVSSLEPPDTSSRPREPISDRQLYWDALEEQTLFARCKQAGRHRRAAAKAELEGEVSRRVWHEQRARGQLERFARIRACLSRMLVRTLQCGCHVGAWQQEIPLGCSDWRVCPVCRSKRVRRYRARFRTARAFWRKQYRFALRSGKYAERFMTLTVPHIGDVAERMAWLKQAWRRFLRRVREHWAKDKALPGNQLQIPWLAVLETTAGEDGRGHPHLHIWMLSAFVPQALLRLYWARSLPAHVQRTLPQRPLEDVLAEHREGIYQRQRSKGGRGWLQRAERQWQREEAELRVWLVTRRGPHGRPLEMVPWPVLDIRRPVDAEAELVKYLVKECYVDQDGDLVYIDPVLGGEIYNAYCGMRALWTSRGFWRDDHEPACCVRCGSCDWHTEILEPEDVLGLSAKRDTS